MVAPSCQKYRVVTCLSWSQFMLWFLLIYTEYPWDIPFYVANFVWGSSCIFYCQKCLLVPGCWVEKSFKTNMAAPMQAHFRIKLWLSELIFLIEIHSDLGRIQLKWGSNRCTYRWYHQECLLLVEICPNFPICLPPGCQNHWVVDQLPWLSGWCQWCQTCRICSLCSCLCG